MIAPDDEWFEQQIALLAWTARDFYCAGFLAGEKAAKEAEDRERERRRVESL